MKHILYTFILFSLTFLANGQVISKTEIRSLYAKSVSDEVSCKKLITTLESFNENTNALWAGYRACAKMMLANHVYNPYHKLSHFNEGKQLLEKCISADKSNVELRFLRFAIQSKAPSFLGYHKSIREDKLILINILKYLKDPELKQNIIAFLKYSDQLSDDEKKKLNQ